MAIVGAVILYYSFTNKKFDERVIIFLIFAVAFIFRLVYIQSTDYLVRQHPQVEGKDIFNCVYSTSKIFREAPVTMPMNRKFFDAVSGHLEKMVGEMCDPDVGFRRTQDEKICGFCDFRTICGR